MSGQLHASAALPPVGWMGRRGGLNDFEKRKFLALPGLDLRLLSRPAP
jgi:hypothetical protein